MASLLVLNRRFWTFGNAETEPPTDQPHAEMNLYCWQHRTAHAFPLADVEKIIYALGAETIDGYDSGYRDGWNASRAGAPWGTDRARMAEDPQDCLMTVLRGADNPEVYTEHVEQGVECRKAASPT